MTNLTDFAWLLWIYKIAFDLSLMLVPCFQKKKKKVSASWLFFNHRKDNCMGKQKTKWQNLFQILKDEHCFSL